MSPLSVLKLTRGEEAKIGKCLSSLLPLTKNIFIVDSGSTDRTVELAEEMGATVAHHPWTTDAKQFNWGLDHFDFETEWIMRMDADEEVTEGLGAALREFLESPPSNIDGVYVRRRVYFMGRWIRHGGVYPTWLLRVFRNGVGRCEALWMDEHIVVGEGDTIKIHQDIIDRNNKDLTFWTDKHNVYASREVMEVLAGSTRPDQTGETLGPSLMQSQAHIRRWLKVNVYMRFPLFVRPFLFFIYRYFIRLGFLDGKEGLIFHFLQGFWYRFLVDAKLYDHETQRRLEVQSNSHGSGGGT